MCIEDVVSLLGSVGEDIGSGSVIHKYCTDTGEILIISYEIDISGVFKVSKIYVGDDELDS